MSNPNLVVICGTTASGKTRLGVEVASTLSGEIISVDSRQVYRGMDLGTGKDLDEYNTAQGRVPHHLIDIVEPSEIYTLYHYQRDFYRVFAEIEGRGRMPVAVGGTGLYLEAVLKYYDIPNVEENVQLRNELMLCDKEDLVVRLAALDAARCEKTDLSSKKRIVRSLEVAMSPVPQQEPRRLPTINPLVLLIQWERSTLRARIRSRLEARLEAGMIDEVKRLIRDGLSRERLELFGLEYRAVSRHLFDKIPYGAMVDELACDIGRFAKRQETWFRGMERRGIPTRTVAEGSFREAEEILASSGLNW